MKPFLFAALAALTLAGCNTIEGVGHDISGGARRIGTWF